MLAYAFDQAPLFERAENPKRGGLVHVRARDQVLEAQELAFGLKRVHQVARSQHGFD